MSLRNGITQIRAAEAVVKQDEKSEQKATAEVKKNDPKNADELVAGNTVLDTFEKKVASGESKDKDQEKQTENEKGGSEKKNKHAKAAHPSTSKDNGGETVESQIK